MTYTVSPALQDTNQSTMNSHVKQERHDEAEIQELAAKMIEAHRAKMQAAGRIPPHPSIQNMNILSFLARKKPDNAACSNGPTEPTQNFGDEESLRGRFGWVTLGKEHIPYIIRSNERYCAVRMVEMRVLNKYLTFLHQDICNCTCIRSYYITEAESKLLNEINIKHCDYHFGRDQFTCRDLIVRLSDAIEFHLFLDSCYTKLLNGSNSAADRCGFIRINKESVVPYTIYNKQKYVPLFYFEGETENLKLKADKLEGWDLAYLKFCCKVQGIRNELFAHDSCSVIGLSDIKNYFPPGTLFEDYWPSKVVDSQLLINGKVQPQVGQWTRQPSGAPPASPVQPAASPKPTVQAKAVNNTQLPNVPSIYSNYPVTAAQPTYPVVQPRTGSTNTAIRSSFSSGAASTTRPIRQPFYAMSSAQAPPPLIRAAQANGPTTNTAIRSSFSSGNTPPRPMRPPFFSSPVQPPPPLIRATQEATPFTTSPNVASTNYLMLGNSTIVPATYRQATPQMHPPPLIPVRHLNGEVRYETPQNHYRANDIVDLSGQNRTLPPQITPQQTHEQSPQPPAQEEHQNMPNGRSSLNNIHQKLIPIADTPTSGNHIPYKMHKAFIESKMIPCINMKPYVYTELLVTIPDLIEQLFNNVPVQSCQQVMQVLRIELYKGNKSQMRVLYDNGKCQSVNDCIPLVPVRLVLEFMPQLKYMLGGLMSSEAAAKRQCTS